MCNMSTFNEPELQAGNEESEDEIQLIFINQQFHLVFI